MRHAGCGGGIERSEFMIPRNGKKIGEKIRTVTVLSLASIVLIPFSSIAETLTLEQVIREVCTKSDSVKMMKESVLKANMLVRENKSAAWPKLSLSTNALYSSPYSEKENVPSGFRPSDTFVKWRELGPWMGDLVGGFATPKSSTTYTGALSLQVPIYTFGKIGSAIKVAETYNKSAQTSHLRNIQTLQLTALDMFYRTMIAIETSCIAEKTLSRKFELYDFINRNFDLGAGVKSHLLMVKADAYGQSAVTIAAKRDAEAARMYLNSFLGRALTEQWTIDTSRIPETLLKTGQHLSDEAIKQSVDQRNDILSLHLMAQSNRSGAKIYKSMQYPSIYGNGSTGYTQIDSKGIRAMEGAFDWSAGVSISWTLFDGFQSSSKAAQFLSDARKLEIIEGTLKKTAEIEIRTAESECRAADSSLVAAQEMFKAASEGYDLTNSSFKEGSGLLTDLQRVDEQLQLAEFGLINARYRQIRSRAALLVAMGQNIITIDSEEQK
jgi:outer membrane protein